MTLGRIARATAFVVALAVVLGCVLFAINDGLARRARLANALPDSAAAYGDFIAYYTRHLGPLEEDEATRLWANGLVLCNNLEDTRSVELTFNAGLDLNMSSDQTATVIEAAVHSFCPELAYLLRSTVTPNRPQPTDYPYVDPYQREEA